MSIGTSCLISYDRYLDGDKEDAAARLQHAIDGCTVPRSQGGLYCHLRVCRWRS